MMKNFDLNLYLAKIGFYRKIVFIVIYSEMCLEICPINRNIIFAISWVKSVNFEKSYISGKHIYIYVLFL